MDESCATCRFFNNQIVAGFGECRRYPIRTRFVGEGDVSARYLSPMTPEGWCGEYQPIKSGSRQQIASTQAESSEREHGWYWIKFESQWLPARWAGYWIFSADEYDVITLNDPDSYDTRLDAVGPRLKPPG